MTDGAGDRRQNRGRRATDIEVEVTLALLQGAFDTLATRLELSLRNLGDRMEAGLRSIDQAHNRIDAIEERARANTRLALTSLIFPVLVAIIAGVLLAGLRS